MHIQQNIFKKILLEIGSSHLYASFGTFCVQIGQLFEEQWFFKLSKEFEIDDIFLRNQWFVDVQAFFKESLCLEKLTNLDAKGTKRSVKMLAINLYIRFFKNILFCTNCGLSKIRLVHTYVVLKGFILVVSTVNSSSLVIFSSTIQIKVDGVA